MSFPVVPLQFSTPYLKICKWVSFIMSLNRKFSGINGRLLTNSKMGVSNGGWKWKKLLLFVWIFVFATGFVWFLFGGVSGEKLEISETSEDNSSVLIQRFNVSKDHLHELASTFFESNQITSMKCTKLLEHETVITCALEVPKLKNHQLEEHHSHDMKYEESSDQQNKENTMRTMVPQNFLRENLNIICLCAIFIMALSFRNQGFQTRLWKNRNRNWTWNRKVHQKKDNKVEGSSRGAGKWMKKLLIIFIIAGIAASIWLFWYLNTGINFRRKETLTNMCDERARMLQDQFNVSMNHVHALAILVSTFYHGKDPPAIDQVIFFHNPDIIIVKIRRI